MTAVAAPETQSERSGEAGVALHALEPTALAATRAAALACRRWVGRGDGKAADRAATEAMRAELASAPGDGTVVIGEGAKDEAPMLFEGERVGDGRGPCFDVAVDPLECTTLCAKGLPGSLTTIAIAPAGSLCSLLPAFYMDKLVGPAAIDEAIDIADAPERNLDRIAEALGKPVEQLRVVVLDKPRHASLVQRLRAAGARVATPPDGDVAGALAAVLPGGGADLLMGVGGTPEGTMTACATRALGGCMQARLAPQSDTERRAALDAGLDLERIYGLEDLVEGDGFFAATGVTGGELLRAPWREEASTRTESIVIAAGAVRTVIESSEEADHGG